MALRLPAPHFALLSLSGGSSSRIDRIAFGSARSSSASIRATGSRPGREAGASDFANLSASFAASVNIFTSGCGFSTG